MARRGRWVAALCAALMVPLGLFIREAGAIPVHSATSAQDQSRPSVMGTVSADSGLSVSIDSLSPRIITTEEEVVISGTIRNDSPTTLASVSVEVFVANETPISISSMTTQLSEDEPDATHAASSTLTDVRRSVTTPFEIRIPTSSLPLTDTEEWGPRVTTVTATSGDFSGKDRTILVWDSGTQVAPSRVSAVVPWTSGNAASTQAERSAVLTLAGTSGVTLAVDPLLIPRGPQPTTKHSPSPSVSASVTDDEAQSEGQSGQSGQSDAPTASPSPSASAAPTPAPTATDPAQRSRDLQAEAFVSSFMSTASEIIALPDADADLGALALSGNTGFWGLASESIDAFPGTPRAAGWVAPSHAHNPGAPSPSATPSTSPTASPSASATPNPTPSATGPSGTMTSKPDSGPTILRNVGWPDDATFGTTFLSNFAAADQIAIAPTSALTPTDEVPFTSMARVNVNPTTGETSTNGTGAHILAQQADISSILSWNASGGDALDAEQALTAITAIITRERPSTSRTLFATAARGTTINDRLSSRASALFSPRWVTTTSFTDMATSEPTDVERATVGTGTLADDTATAITEMSTSLTLLIPLANATDDPDAVFDSVTPQVLPALTAGRTPSEQLDSATAMTSQVATMLSSVTVEPSSAVNLINKSANFPVLIRNNLDWPVRVDVTLIPDDPRLRATPAQSQLLAAHGATTVEVPVGAIGSGNIEVTYKVTTPDGHILDESQTVFVRMRAGWEDAITAVIAALFGLLFLVGITRSIRGRSRRKAEASTASGSTDEPVGSTEAPQGASAPETHPEDPEKASDTADENTDSKTATTKETP